jgi:methionyl-tRNA synthetase
VRVRRLNRYVEEQAPWALAKDPGQAEHLKVVLRSLAEGLRVVTVLLHPYMPKKTRTILEALGDGSLDLARAELGAGDRGQAVAKLEPLFPRAAKQ